MSEHIAYDVAELASLTPFPGNPRVGDLDEIKTSLVRFGQYRTIVVWPNDEQRVIVAGNHTTRAMRELAALDPVTYEQTYRYLAPDGAELRSFDGTARIELTRFAGWDEARRVNAADNRLAELGRYDDDALRVLLETFGEDWAGSGGTPEDLAGLKADFQPDGGAPPPLDQLTPRLCQRCGYDVANDPERLAE